MKININGITRDMTPEEIAEFNRMAESMPKPEPTPEERMTEIEAALIELAAMMAEADLKNKGYINEQDFKYIIAKQKIDYKKKLIQEARMSYILSYLIYI